jgi:hypothetical protein
VALSGGTEDRDLIATAVKLMLASHTVLRAGVLDEDGKLNDDVIKLVEELAELLATLRGRGRDGAV